MQYLDRLPRELTHLELGTKSELPLPSSILSLTIGNKFNHVDTDRLPREMTHLEFGKYCTTDIGLGAITTNSFGSFRKDLDMTEFVANNDETMNIPDNKRKLEMDYDSNKKFRQNPDNKRKLEEEYKSNKKLKTKNL